MKQKPIFTASEAASGLGLRATTFERTGRSLHLRPITAWTGETVSAVDLEIRRRRAEEAEREIHRPARRQKRIDRRWKKTADTLLAWWLQRSGEHRFEVAMGLLDDEEG